MIGNVLHFFQNIETGDKLLFQMRICIVRSVQFNSRANELLVHSLVHSKRFNDRQLVFFGIYVLVEWFCNLLVFFFSSESHVRQECPSFHVGHVGHEHGWLMQEYCFDCFGINEGKFPVMNFTTQLGSQINYESIGSLKVTRPRSSRTQSTDDLLREVTTTTHNEHNEGHSKHCCASLLLTSCFLP